jgi:CRP-like cAMP-binding protein
MSNVQCHNDLIIHLNVSCRHALLKHCEWVLLAKETVLNLPNQAMHHAYFPAGAVIVLMMQQFTEKSLELALIGEEGFHGIEPLLGVAVSPTRAIVHAEGMALKIPISSLLRLMEQHTALRTSLHTYIVVVNAQLAQSSVCNRFHQVQQRLAKLLLMLQDRLHSSSFFITQDSLASMLGVRRVGVTKAASQLQQQGILHYSRGHMEIINRPALIHAACHCYAQDTSTYATIMNA